jgi:hypothetical protein
VPRRVGLALGAALALLAALAGSASAAISSSFDGTTGALTVSSNAGDGMDFSCIGGKVRVNFAAVTGDPNCSAVTSIVVNGGPQANGIILQGVDVNYPSVTSITISGGDGGDSITGSPKADTIDGGPGGDFVDALGGNDVVRTNDEGGGDDLGGGTGTTDTLVLFGTVAQGVVVGPSDINANGTQILHSGFDRGQFDTPAGEPSIDLTTAPWPSTVNGGSGNETVWSSPFNDTLNLGGQGIADIAGAKVDGPNITITAGGMSGGGVGNDVWTGVERASLLSPSALGTPGAPVVDSTWDATLANRPVTMQGGTGNDTFFGSTFGDTLGMPANPGGPEETGDDVFNGAGGTDTIQAGPGTDTIRKFGVQTATATATALTADGESDNYAAGGLERIELTGTASGDTLTATTFAGRVIFNGGAGADQLTGAGGDDRLTGGGGTDTATGGNGTDTVAEAATLAANLTVTPAQVTDGPNSVAMTSIERVEVTGSASGDTMDASTFAGTVLFDGAGGNDTLTGGLGADTLLGGVGGDTLNAQGDNAADATIDCGADTDTANVDLADPATANCETVNAPSPPGSGNPGSGNPGSGNPGSGSGGVDVVAPTMGLTAGRVDRRGRFVLRVSCPATETGCTGEFRLVARNAKGKRITVGRGRFAVEGGKVAAVKVRLNRAGRRLFRGKKRLPVTVTMTARDTAGNAATTSRRLTLKPKPRR